MHTSDPVLSLENLTVAYGHANAITDVSLWVAPGETLALIGSIPTRMPVSYMRKLVTRSAMLLVLTWPLVHLALCKTIGCLLGDMPDGECIVSRETAASEYEG